MQRQDTPNSSTAERWTRRIGIAAFLFFFIKGLLWLIVPAVVAYFAFN